MRCRPAGGWLGLARSPRWRMVGLGTVAPLADGWAWHGRPAGGWLGLALSPRRRMVALVTLVQLVEGCARCGRFAGGGSRNVFHTSSVRRQIAAPTKI